jgi:hypothetical protein
MKMKQLMLFVAAATMLFAACSKDEDTTTATAAGDNQMVYNGKTYQGESMANVNDNNAMLECYSETDGIQFMISCHIQNPSNYTYDLTQEDADHVLHFHIVVESPAVQSQEDIFDLQYQNGPHFWYFLNGDNVSNVSAFTSGTAETTLTDTSLILNVSGTLVNGKSLAFRVVLPREE